MCIEKELAANTAAVNALTAAISQLIGSLSGRCSCADCRDVVVEPSAPAAISQQAPAPTAPEQPKVAPAPASAPAPAPAPAPVDLNSLRAVCVRAGQAGLTQDVVGFLASAGVKLLTELPPERYPELLAMLAAKGVR